MLSKSINKIIFSLFTLTLIAVGLFFVIAYGWLGIHDGPGKITNQMIPKEIIKERTQIQTRAATNINADNTKQILFGELFSQAPHQ